MRVKSTLLFLAALASGAALQAGESDHEKLFSLIRSGDVRGLKALLDQGTSPNSPDDRQVTPLMYAAAAGTLDAMKLLLDRGADVDAQNASGGTVLMWSAPDAGKVRLLLDRGAHVNIASKSGRTALMLAAFSPSSGDAVRLLLSKGADVNTEDRGGMTALMAAAGSNNFPAVRMLVEAGADVNHRGGFPQNIQRITPLMVAAGTGNLSAVQLLLEKGARADAVSDRENLPRVKNGSVAAGGFTPLLRAATYGPPDLVKALLNAGADVNAADVRGMTPLMLAATTDRLNPEIIKVLLAHGADKARKSVTGETAMDWARRYGSSDALEALGLKAEEQERAPVTPVAVFDVRTAVRRSVQLLERNSAGFFLKSGCFACHAQVSADFAVSAARSKGVTVDEGAAKERLLQSTSTPMSVGPGIMEYPNGGDDGFLYLMEALGRTGYAPNRLTDYLAARIAADQDPNGAWHGNFGLARTPLEDGNFSRTAMAIRTLKKYGTPARAAENKQRIERAAAWLISNEPVVTEDRAMRLAGLAAAGFNPVMLRQIARRLLLRQRHDGSWAQRDEWASDGYATGMALWALAEAGMPLSDGAWQRGVQFLLETQRADGSWHVISRAARFQPYFESGFPYGHDQWISAMGTGWAASALALAIDTR
jgi:ankyrin repeat protein